MKCIGIALFIPEVFVPYTDNVAGIISLTQGSGHVKFGNMEKQKPKLSRIRKAGNLFGGILNLLGTAIVVFPEITAFVRKFTIIAWPLFIVFGSTLMIWGNWARICGWHKTIRYCIVGFPVFVLIAWLGWPWPRITGLFYKEIQVESEEKSSGTYWSGYMSEQDALKIWGYYIGLIRNWPPSEVAIREALQQFTRDGTLQVRWRRIGDNEWRYDLPIDSVNIVFEVNKYGPREYSEPKLFEREYYTSSIMSLGAANWKKPDWTLPDIR